MPYGFWPRLLCTFDETIEFLGALQNLGNSVIGSEAVAVRWRISKDVPMLDFLSCRGLLMSRQGHIKPALKRNFADRRASIGPALSSFS